LPEPKPIDPTASIFPRSSKIEAFEAALVLLEKDPAKRELIRAAAPGEARKPAGTFANRAQALLWLVNSHQAQTSPAPIRVHEKWRKALLAKQPASVLASMATPGEPEAGSLAAIALDAAQSLTFERLVGDLPPTPEDPAVLRFFQGDSRQQWLRRVVWAGRLKRALGTIGHKNKLGNLFVHQPDEWSSMAASTMARFFTGLPAKAKSDAHLGLVTVASLASRLDLRRRQWLLQHLSMQLGPLLATWLRIGKPPWPEEQIVMEAWIAAMACELADGNEPAQVQVEPAVPQQPMPTPVPVVELEVMEESVELLQTISNDSALFDLDMPGLDELEFEEDDSSFHIGDLKL